MQKIQNFESALYSTSGSMPLTSFSVDKFAYFVYLYSKFKYIVFVINYLSRCTFLFDEGETVRQSKIEKVTYLTLILCHVLPQKNDNNTNILI